MTDSKRILVFGSFTEDETRSLFKGQSSKSNEKMPVEKKELQFGSLNFGTGITFGDFSGELNSQLGSTNGKKVFQPKNLKEKDEAITEKVDSAPGLLGSRKENGSIDNSLQGSPLNNGIKDLKAETNRSIDNSLQRSPLNNGIRDLKVETISLTPLCLSKREIGAATQSQVSNFHVLDNEDVKDRDQGETGDLSSVFVKKEERRKETIGPVSVVRNLLPRGLINSGNLCFLNATLQALLSCSPFVQLLQELRIRNIPKVGFPTLTAFAEFVADFDMPSGSNSKNDIAVVETGSPLSPVMFEGVLENFTPDVPNSISGWPRQEDAQEFLSFIMDRMHDELLKLEGRSASTNGVKSSIVSSAEEDEWETVGRKNKSAVTRTQSFLSSELSDIFGGQLRSVVKAKGNKASATVQPFLLLHLDIYPEDVRTIEDALHLFSAQENLEGYRAQASGQAGVVSARKSVKIQTLSRIMILHLMRFSYGNQGSTKLHKPVHFPLELMLGRELLVSPSTESRKYELVATITHHGRDPSKGHYTADARYPCGQWLRFDDASVSAISTSKVLHDQAYVLFYKQV